MPKLDSRATRMMLVGQGEKGFMVYNPKENKLYFSRNVKIIEKLNYYQPKKSYFAEMEAGRTNTSQDKVKKDDIDIPANYKDAIKSENKEAWNAAMLEEYRSLVDNDVFEEVDEGSHKIIDTRWVFTIKRDQFGSPFKFKTRMVAKGYNQVQGLDYFESYAPVGEKSTMRILFTLAAKRNHEVYHLDVERAFLNGALVEDVFLRPPEPFRNEGKVWKLKKALYGLRQAPKAWNDHVVETLKRLKFKQSKVDNCLFIKEDVFVLIYVDDILISTDKEEKYYDIRNTLGKYWKLHDLGPVNKFLGINIKRRNGGFELNQEDYIISLANKFGTKNSNLVSKPLPSGIDGLENCKEKTNRPIQHLIGSLLYIANSTRPDILAAVSILARYTNQQSELLWRYSKQVLKYLQSTYKESLALTGSGSIQMETYADADFASDPNSRKSQTGFLIKVFGSPVSWYSRKQSTVSASSTEAEYVALASAASYTYGLIQLLEDFMVKVSEPVPIYEDNQLCIQIALGSSKIKHLDVKLHFIRDLIRRKIITITHIDSRKQIADCLTKANPKMTFNVIRKGLGLTQNQGKC